MTIEIRKGTKEDIPKIKECLVDSWVEHARQEPELLDEEKMRQSDIEGYYTKCFEDPNNSFVLIAEEDGKLVGFQRADVKEIPEFFKNNKILYLDDAYVLPEFRRKGIATKLIVDAERIAKDMDIKRIQSRVYTFNKPTQELLKSLGYRSPHATWDKVLK